MVKVVVIRGVLVAWLVYGFFERFFLYANLTKNYANAGGAACTHNAVKNCYAV